MKKATTKKATAKMATAKKAKAATKTAKVATKPVTASAAKGKVSGGVVAKQPQVKQDAAVAHAMFLATDDTWSQPYFDQNDLHFLEREVFG
jgi:hypothetical protein